MSIQQSVNQGLSIFSLFYGQTTAGKIRKAIQESKSQKKVKKALEQKGVSSPELPKPEGEETGQRAQETTQFQDIASSGLNRETIQRFREKNPTITSNREARAALLRQQQQRASEIIQRNREAVRQNRGGQENG